MRRLGLSRIDSDPYPWFANIEPRKIVNAMPGQLELTGWGEIADYLGVSVRTAQVYERDRGLPVHHLAGPKGRVWADARALDVWKQTSARKENQRQNLSNEPKSFPDQPSLDIRPRRRRLVAWVYSLATAIVILGMAIGIRALSHPDKRPTAWRVAGSTLTILGEDGRELGRHAFPSEMKEDVYLPDRPRPAIFVDLRGDGTPEILFKYCPRDEPASGMRLVCLNTNGKVRWEFASNHSVTDSQLHEWTPPFILGEFAVISPKVGPSRIVVTSNHFFSYPDQVAVLDSSGQLVSEFWHRGHIPHLAVADLDGDGQPEVLLGGVNDAPEYKQATLLVFDHRSISGASSSPGGETYFRGFGHGTEKAEVFFPRTPCSARQEYNKVKSVMLGPRRITVIVAESIDENDPNYVIYDMDFSLNVISAVLSDNIKASYRELEAKGEIPKGTVLSDGERLKRDVTVIRRH